MLLHPANRILLFLSVAVLAQQLAAPLLLLLLLAAALTGSSCRLRAWQLVRRTRWLLLTLFLVFALASPGTPVLAATEWITHEGVLNGVQHVLRLLVILVAVAVLLETTANAEIIAGCWVLLSPLSLARRQVERLLVRLLLVLHYVETLPPLRGWRCLLAAEVPDGVQETMALQLLPVRTADRLSGGMILLGAVLLLCL